MCSAKVEMPVITQQVVIRTVHGAHVALLSPVEPLQLAFLSIFRS